MKRKIKIRLKENHLLDGRLCKSGKVVSMNEWPATQLVQSNKATLLRGTRG